MQFPAHWLQKPITNRPAGRYTEAPATDNVPPEEFVAAIAEALLPHIHLHELNVSQAARFCGYSQRSLSRRLSEQGTPTPNVFDGGYNYHSRQEWAALPAMVRAAQVVINLAEIWAGAS